MLSLLTLFGLAFVQNISFTMASRSRNRSSMAYHAVCAVFSNSLWFATIHYLVVADLTWLLFIPYVAGTVLGSLAGGKVSMAIEKRIDATF